MNKTRWKELIKKAPHAQKLTNKNIKYPTKKEQLEAVRKNGDSIQYIHSPDKKVQLEAVKQNGKSIQYIHDPDKEIVVHYLLAVCPELLRDPKCDLKED